ncbi:peptidyl-prolyl cis-trans isomerase [Tumebacillus sp. BK434]|uniref:peptidyl-prolyl cis-trans isomerase n=1 Tax=Tumebacillus sp. BK434 TaxID=2512169 RepID=UPI001404D75B|nr:peptidyl-prolyl cis-trans isomerase [Tumebacillus sp. BK434]
MISGSVLLFAGLFYNPLLFAVEEQTMRKTEWEALRPSLFAGLNYSREEEQNLLQQRSLEELVLFKGRELGITADEAAVAKQLEQLGTTPADRAAVLKDLHMTEEDAKNNYRRALVGFELKKRMTQDMKVTEEEMLAYYNENKMNFYVPEFRTIRYLRAKADDAATVSRMKGITAASFQTVIEQFQIDPNGRMHAWEELASQAAFAQNTSEQLAAFAFAQPKGKVAGPVQDGEWIYWLNIEDTTEPHQQTYQESRQKIYSLLYQEKQANQFRSWIEAQKEPAGYGVYPDNLTASRWEAFWSDLPHNFRLLF